MIVVSSAYWLTRNSVLLLSYDKQVIPWMFGASLIVSAKGSACIMNSKADSELPCLTPHFTGKKREIRPFVIMALFACLYKILIHVINFFPKPNASKVLTNQLNSTLSKAFSWSSNNIQLLSSVSFSIKSSSMRMHSALFRPGMHSRWSSWIISSIIVLSLFDKILVMIL